MHLVSHLHLCSLYQLGIAKEQWFAKLWLMCSLNELRPAHSQENTHGLSGLVGRILVSTPHASAGSVRLAWVARHHSFRLQQRQRVSVCLDVVTVILPDAQKPCVHLEP